MRHVSEAAKQIADYPSPEFELGAGGLSVALQIGAASSRRGRPSFLSRTTQRPPSACSQRNEGSGLTKDRRAERALPGTGVPMRAVDEGWTLSQPRPSVASELLRADATFPSKGPWKCLLQSLRGKHSERKENALFPGPSS